MESCPVPGLLCSDPVTWLPEIAAHWKEFRHGQDKGSGLND